MNRDCPDHGWECTGLGHEPEMLVCGEITLPDGHRMLYVAVTPKWREVGSNEAAAGAGGRAGVGGPVLGRGDLDTEGR